LDLYEDGGALRVELSFRELDLQALGGDVEGRIRARLSLDGRAPLDVKALPPSPRFAYRRWEARFAPPLPASFVLRAPLFDQGGWIRIYDFLPGAVDPGERNWILEQGTAFRFPEARSPGRISVWGRFFRLGFHHILPAGWDHLLFVLGLCLGASGVARLLGLLTAFTLGHSLSLALVASGRWSLSPRLVEPLIALSIAWVAVENLGWRKQPAAWRWVLVLALGLLHGLGFGRALAETGVPMQAFWPAILAFNGGVEVGQILAMTAFFALWNFVPRPALGRLKRGLSLGLAGVGVLLFFLRITDV
jgi:hypothetical protein